MHISRTTLAFALGAVLSGFCCSEAKAGLIYTYSYTGNDFATFVGDTTLNASDFVSASFTFAGPIPGNEDYSFGPPYPQLLAWTISDQVNAFSQVSDGPSPSGGYLFATDAQGDITGWIFLVQPAVADDGEVAVGSVDDPNAYYPQQDGSYISIPGNPGAYSNNDPGAWVETTASATPEPSAALLLALGGAILLSDMKRKHCVSTGR